MGHFLIDPPGIDSQPPHSKRVDYLPPPPLAPTPRPRSPSVFPSGHSRTASPPRTPCPRGALADRRRRRRGNREGQGARDGTGCTTGVGPPGCSLRPEGGGKGLRMQCRLTSCTGALDQITVPKIVGAPFLGGWGLGVGCSCDVVMQDIGHHRFVCGHTTSMQHKAKDVFSCQVTNDQS